MRQLADQHASDLKGYIKWSKTLGEQVTHLGEQVQQLADQHASDLKGYIGWSENMAEQQGILNAQDLHPRRPNTRASLREYQNAFRVREYFRNRPLHPCQRDTTLPVREAHLLRPLPTHLGAGASKRTSKV